MSDKREQLGTVSLLIPVVPLKEFRQVGTVSLRKLIFIPLQDVCRSTGVLLDPVYSGKAVHAMLKEIKSSPEEWCGEGAYCSEILSALPCIPEIIPYCKLTGWVEGCSSYTLEAYWACTIKWTSCRICCPPNLRSAC